MTKHVKKNNTVNPESIITKEYKILKINTVLKGEGRDLGAS